MRYRLLFLNTGADVSLENLELSGGYCKSWGGAIYSVGATLRLSSCLLRDNHAGVGAIASRYTKDGGAIYVYGGSLVMVNCIVTGNTATGSGGGVYVSHWIGGGSLEMVNCAVTGNNAVESGGGIHLAKSASSLNMTHCVVSNNTARGGDGGGIYLKSDAFAILENCTFQQNMAYHDGGGIFVEGEIQRYDVNFIVLDSQTRLVNNTPSQACGAAVRAIRAHVSTEENQRSTQQAYQNNVLFCRGSASLRLLEEPSLVSHANPCRTLQTAGTLNVPHAPRDSCSMRARARLQHFPAIANRLEGFYQRVAFAPKEGLAQALHWPLSTCATTALPEPSATPKGSPRGSSAPTARSASSARTLRSRQTYSVLAAALADTAGPAKSFLETAKAPPVKCVLQGGIALPALQAVLIAQLEGTLVKKAR